MKAKNVLSIFLSKFSIVYKIILFLIVLTLFTSILVASSCLPLLHGLFSDIKELEIPKIAGDYIKAEIQDVNATIYYDKLVEAVKEIPNLIKEWNANIIGSTIALVIIIFIFSLFYFMANYTIADMLKTFMSTNSKFGFTSNYIYNFKKSIIFSLLYIPYAFAFYILTGIISIAVGFLFAKISLLLGVYSLVLVAIALLSLRRALTAYWLPITICEDMSSSQAFLQNFAKIKTRFWGLFGTYFIIYILALVIIVLLSLCTAGVGLIVGYVMLWFIMQIVDMVDYYHFTGKKYYIDDQKVVDPTKQFKDVVIDEFKL